MPLGKQANTVSGTEPRRDARQRGRLFGETVILPLPGQFAAENIKLFGIQYSVAIASIRPSLSPSSWGGSTNSPAGAGLGRREGELLAGIERVGLERLRQSPGGRTLLSLPPGRIRTTTHRGICCRRTLYLSRL